MEPRMLGIAAVLLLVLAGGILIVLAGASSGSPQGMEEVLSCRNSTVREKELCYDLFMERKIALNSTRELMDELASVMERSDEMRLNCHGVAHSVGRVSVLAANLSLADAFSACTQTCHSGCYHGAMQTFFLKETIPDADVYQLRDEHVSLSDLKRVVNTTCREMEDEGAKWFQCLHGMGHAIQFSLNNNLTLALEVCDLLGSYYERNSCYGGAIMENLVSPERETRLIRRDSPQYPCSELDERYMQQCYMMQPSVMMEIFDYDVGKVVAACGDAGAYAGTCYLGLGRDLSDDFRVGKETVYTVMDSIPAQHRMDYVRGLIYALADNTWDGRYAFPFCSGLDDLESECYSTATGYLKANLFVSIEDIEGSCRAHSPDVQECLESMQE